MRRQLKLLLLSALAVAGCYTPQLENRPCGPNGECLDGYTCVTQNELRVCVPGGPTAGGEAGGGTAGGSVGGGTAGGSVGGGTAGGSVGGGDAGFAGDGGLEVGLQVLSATGRMSGAGFQIDIAVGEPLTRTTMTGGPWTITTSTSLQRNP
jgi:hypothetical protein